MNVKYSWKVSNSLFCGIKTDSKELGKEEVCNGKKKQTESKVSVCKKIIIKQKIKWKNRTKMETKQETIKSALTGG